MNIILTEKVNNLGNLGDIVKVKPGYARNYLLPQGKAIRATKENIEIFDKERSKREEENSKSKDMAEKLSKDMKDVSLIILRPASETGLLYGSVSKRDISKLLQEQKHLITHKQVVLEKTIKNLGIYNIEIKLHPEIGKNIKLNIARTEEEALIQEKTGKAVVESVEEKIDDSIDPKNINEIRTEKLDKDNDLNETSEVKDLNETSEVKDLNETSEVNDLQDNLAKN